MTVGKCSADGRVEGGPERKSEVIGAKRQGKRVHAGAGVTTKGIDRTHVDRWIHTDGAGRNVQYPIAYCTVERHLVGAVVVNRDCGATAAQRQFQSCRCSR